MADWRSHLIEDDDGVTRLLARVHRVAVLGIKPESRAWAPAFFVPEYAVRAGLEVIPVPVYYPEVTEILGRPVHRSLAGIGLPIDLVDVFRRSEHVPMHLDDMLAARPGAVWMQSGIRNDDVARALAREGIDVVQDHCLKVELMRRGR